MWACDEHIKAVRVERHLCHELCCNTVPDRGQYFAVGRAGEIGAEYVMLPVGLDVHVDAGQVVSGGDLTAERDVMVHGDVGSYRLVSQ